MLQIVATLTDDSRGVIYNCNIFIIQATEAEVQIQKNLYRLLMISILDGVPVKSYLKGCLV